MPPRKITLGDYTVKSLKWCIGNALFAFFLIILLQVANWMSVDNTFNIKIHDMVQDGVIEFVCCAIVGAVMVEFWVAGFSYTTNEILLIFVTPIVMHALLALEYILMLLHVAAKESFTTNSWTCKIVITFSAIYCILGKTNYYIREDERYEKQRIQHHH